ncbi:hypothetical protein AAG570_006403 [Ranatra chinensis]|uniref:FYVE-type domain-containing protein n=1 Tax=Ranatra chinensis TaxID=642074 RepID=A0ABD0YTV4_9HEMI
MENYVPKQLIRSKSGLRIVARKESLCSPFIIQEPEWIPDKEISNCMKCRTKFGFTTRKHHCRRCGQIFCNDCCDTRLELPRMCFVDPVRICVNCEPQTKIENTFFEKHVKVLTQGDLYNYLFDL